MPSLETSAGPVHYEDTGEGAPVVLLHGVLMDHTQWDPALPHLPPGHRYLRPTLPLGAHRQPMRHSADLGMAGQVRLLAEVLTLLDLDDVTLVVTDWGGPLLLESYGLSDRIGRLVICPCEAFDNFPPGIPGRLASLAPRIPGALPLALRQLRSARLRRSPLLLGAMAAEPIPDAIVHGWTEPALTDARIRRDLHSYVSGQLPRTELRRRTESLSDFTGDSLVLWHTIGTVMPAEHGPRLAALLPHARLAHVTGAAALVMLDQPARTAAQISAFLGQGARARQHEERDR